MTPYESAVAQLQWGRTADDVVKQLVVLGVDDASARVAVQAAQRVVQNAARTVAQPEPEPQSPAQQPWREPVSVSVARVALCVLLCLFGVVVVAITDAGCREIVLVWALLACAGACHAVFTRT